jgi:hypothetical protein
MTSNQLPEDVRAELKGKLAYELCTQWPPCADHEEAAGAAIDTIAPLIIEWAQWDALLSAADDMPAGGRTSQYWDGERVEYATYEVSPRKKGPADWLRERAQFTPEHPEHSGHETPEAAPSDTDREALAAMIEPDAFDPKSKVYWNVNPDRVDHIRSNARVRADRILAAGFSRTSQPVQVEVTEHKITQRMPWPPSPESRFMLSLFECSCGWKTNTFKDTRDNRATIEDYRQYAESHAAALGGGGDHAE